MWWDRIDFNEISIAGFIALIHLFLVCLFFYFIPLNTLLWSLFKAILLNDIKSIIALSTISLIYFILLDELIIGSVQRRIGPLNLGWYGILSSIINGCNLITTQLIIPKLHFYFGFQLFPIFFFLFTIILQNRKSN